MIVSNDYPYLNVKFDVRGKIYTVRAYIDTGFYVSPDSYSLMIPKRFRDELEKPDFYEKIALTNDSKVRIPYYRGSVKIDKVIRHVFILCCGDNEFLICREFVDEFKVCFEKGKRIIIDDC